MHAKKIIILIFICAAVLHKLISCGQLHGSLRGHGDRALYIPNVYIHMQNNWSDSFLASNGYLGMYIRMYVCTLCACMCILVHYVHA